MDAKKVKDLSAIAMINTGIFNAYISKDMGWYFLFVLGFVIMITNSGSNERLHH